MKALSKLYLANLTEFLSNRRALFLTIAFPVLFIVIFGAVFTNQDKADAVVGIVVEDKADPISAEIIKALESAPKGDLTNDGTLHEKEREKNPFSELTFREGTKAALVEDLRKGRLDAIITIPAGLARQAAAVKEHALRDAAGQMEKLQREQAPPQAQAGTPGMDAAADEAARTRVQASLRDQGVPTAIYYPRPLHRQPAYAAQHDGSGLPVSEDLARRILALPIHPDLTDADVERVCDSVAAAFG